ncbi:hypothetical protein H5410_058874 [Solanum commersonii]|uniref:Uncharacterized protein n=1 Tax=Solanum commersonii TaxID=4109 RepID=A0A9J5W192_SOLCO|nr:hypothetical protein H5410_058874 [Solanum commersonii]
MAFSGKLAGSNQLREIWLRRCRKNMKNSDLILAKPLPAGPLRPYLWSQLALTTKSAYFKSQISLGIDLTYGASWPSWSKQPIFKKSTWTSVKTLLMEKVGPHGQNCPFSRSNDPRSSWPSRAKHPTFKVKRSPEQFALTIKMAHFKGQMIPAQFSIFFRDPESHLIFAKILLERLLRLYQQSQLALTTNTSHLQGQIIPGAFLTYGANWPSRPKWPIFKSFDLIFAKILPGRLLRPYLWSQLALMAKTAHFQGQMNPRANLTYVANWPSRPKWPIFRSNESRSRPYLWRQLTHTAKTAHFQDNWPSLLKHPIFKVKRSPEQFMEILVIQNSDLIFAKKFNWTSVTTIPMEPVGPNDQNSSFLRSNDLGAVKTSHFQGETIPGAVHEFFGNPEFRYHICKIFTWMSIKTLPVEPVGPHENITRTFVKTLPMEPDVPNGQNDPFSRSNDHRCKKSPNFAYFRNFDLIFAKNLPGRLLRRYLWSQLALMAKTAHFQGQMNSEQFTIFFGDPEFRPYFCKTFTWTSVKTLSMELVGPHGQNGPFSRSNKPRSSYGASWPSRPKQPILKVKLSPEQVNPPFCQFLYAIVHGIFGDPKLPPHFCKNFNWTYVKTLHMELVGPYNQNSSFSRSNDLESSWPSRPKWPILKNKLSPEQTLPMELIGPHDKNDPFSRSNESRSISPSLLMIGNCDLIFTKNFPGHPLRPYLWIQLVLTDKLAHFHGQTIPGAVHEIFGDPEFRPHFCQNIAWTSVKTLPMEPVGPHDQIGPFASAIVHGIFGDPEFRPHFCQNITWTSVKSLPWSQLDLMA